MNIHSMGVLHSFSIKNIFHDKMDLKLFYFDAVIGSKIDIRTKCNKNITIYPQLKPKWFNKNTKKFYVYIKLSIPSLIQNQRLFLVSQIWIIHCHCFKYWRRWCIKDFYFYCALPFFKVAFGKSWKRHKIQHGGIFLQFLLFGFRPF